MSVYLPHDFRRELVSEGACPYGHGPLAIVQLHDRQQGACYPCGCSWYVEGDTTWGCACVPGNHSCGRRQTG